MFTTQELEQIAGLYKAVTITGIEQAKTACNIYEKVMEELRIRSEKNVLKNSN